MALPIAPFAQDFQGNFTEVLGQSFRTVAASLLAYLVAQFNDVFIFHHLKKRFAGQHKWLRNNVSTMTSQMIDTILFITVAFWGIVPNLLMMIISQYIIKFVIALLDTPIFYLVTRSSPKQHDRIKGTNS